MVQAFDLKKIETERNNIGFIDLIKNLSDFVRGYNFITEGNLLASQNDIQQKSYLFSEHLFSADGHFVWCGKQMQLYLAKIDITEISHGVIDLTSPERQNPNYTSEQALDIFKENNIALNYLKNPFSPELLSDSFTEQLSELNTRIENLPQSESNAFINDFMNLNQKHLNEVVLFCEALGLICISQSLYAFSYQIGVNKNFARLIELVLRVKDFPAHDVGQIKTLANRFYSIFVGNLAARVFSDQTLSVVEQALSVEIAK